MTSDTTPYGSSTTTDQVLDGIDLAGTVTLVTGASAGLGVETARAIAAHGGDVVMAVRDLSKGEAAADAARAAAATTGARVELRQVDLASLDSVRSFTDALTASLAADERRLDVIVANAGVMATPEGRTVDGFETQFGTNHLGHFLLVNRMRPAMNPNASRVVSLTSTGHRFGDVALDDVNFERTPYDPWVAYGRSKSANSLFAVELDRRGRAHGLRACAVHPGGILTELGRHLTKETFAALEAARAGRSVSFKSVEAGAATSVWAAFVADADVVGGRYCEDCGVAEVTTDASQDTGVFPHAVAPDTAAALWSASERFVGERFGD